MSMLSAAQMHAVSAPPDLPDGVEWPEIRYEIHDLGYLPDYDFFRHPRQEHTLDGEAPSVAGYCAVVQRESGKWSAHREYDGGSSGSIHYATREEAISDLEAGVAGTAAFWMEKVGWRLVGDRAPGDNHWRHRNNPRPVIRCGGTHYVIGHEPSTSELESNRRYGGLGFSGTQMAFRMLATGERVQSRNVWYQGRIPAEFRDLLPDNAESVESDDLLRQRERAAARQEETAAKRLERQWKDDAHRAWRSPVAELAAHDQLLAQEREEKARRAVDEERWEAEHLEAQWREEAYRAWRGSWVDLLTYERDREEAEAEWAWERYETERDALYGGGW